MPSVSQAQNRFMHATAEGKTAAPVSVGKEFVAADAGSKVSDLPEQIGQKRKRTRRGRRRKKGQHGDPKQHHQAVADAMARGDHHAAKQHAFALVRSLHGKTGGKTSGPMGPQQPPHASPETPAAPAFDWGRLAKRVRRSTKA